MADLKGMLTETAFVIPGTKVAVPRWAVIGAAGGLIVILLLVKKQGAAGQEGDTSEADEEGGGSWLDDLAEEIATQPTDVDNLTPVDLPDWTYTEMPTPEENAGIGSLFKIPLSAESKYGAPKAGVTIYGTAVPSAPAPSYPGSGDLKGGETKKSTAVQVKSGGSK